MTTQKQLMLTYIGLCAYELYTNAELSNEDLEAVSKFLRKIRSTTSMLSDLEFLDLLKIGGECVYP